jgi:hypothetical protein
MADAKGQDTQICKRKETAYKKKKMYILIELHGVKWSIVVWSVTWCSLTEVHECLRGTYWFNFQGQRYAKQATCRWSQYIAPKWQWIFLILHTVSRTPWIGDQPFARPLTQTQISKPRVRFEATTTVFERAKTVHALDHAATCSARSVLLFFLMALPAHSGPWPLIPFRNHFPQMVWLFGRVISSSQGRYLHTWQNKHGINADIHDLSVVRTHDPSIRASENSSCLRRSGYRCLVLQT